MKKIELIDMLEDTQRNLEGLAGVLYSLGLSAIEGDKINPKALMFLSETVFNSATDIEQSLAKDIDEDTEEVEK